MRYFALLLCFAAAGCSPLKTKYESLHVGDSDVRILEIMGVPDHIEPDQSHPGTNIWLYSQGRERCAIALKDALALEGACVKDGPTAGQRVGAVFSGMGNGLAGVNNNRVNCTTTGGAGMYQTSCR